LRFERYFRTYDQGMRNMVADRFLAVAKECSSQTNIATTFCSDRLKLCQSDYISVTLGNKITNCDLFWKFPVVTDSCHAYDQATLTIHETTHVEGVFDPSTVDFPKNYGWPALTYLNAQQAVTNADNYQYFANGK
jgi:deuterolysin